MDGLKLPTSGLDVGLDLGIVQKHENDDAAGHPEHEITVDDVHDSHNGCGADGLIGRPWILPQHRAALDSSHDAVDEAVNEWDP